MPASLCLRNPDQGRTPSSPSGEPVPTPALVISTPPSMEERLVVGSNHPISLLRTEAQLPSLLVRESEPDPSPPCLGRPISSKQTGTPGLARSRINGQFACLELLSGCATLRCKMKYILLEMDIILRPEGAVIFQVEVDVLIKLKKMISSMKWNSKLADHEDGPLVPENILVSVKQFWVTGGKNKTAHI